MRFWMIISVAATEVADRSSAIDRDGWFELSPSKCFRRDDLLNLVYG